MDGIASWYERLAFRWAFRQAVAQGRPEFTGRISGEVVIPEDREGRPGYRLTTAGTSTAIRAYAGYGKTTDFNLGTGQRSRLLGTCNGRMEGSLEARADVAVKHALDQHGASGVTCVVEPHASHLAGEDAISYRLEVTRGPLAGLTITDSIFDHDGWCFTAGAFNAPDDGPASHEMAAAILASWAWLPRQR